MKRLHLFWFVIVIIMNIIIGSMVQGKSKTKKHSRPISALIAVDVQNCFISGNLALSKCPAGQDGADVIPVINNLIRTIPFDVIVYTRDWHPQDHISFFDSLDSRRQYLKGDKDRTINIYDEVIYLGPKFESKQVLWPSHCVQGTEDAELHKDLYVIPEKKKAVHIRKGIDVDIDSYSAFADNIRSKTTELHNKLKERNVKQVFIAGLATDYCVATTAFDAVSLNYSTYVIEDATRGVALDTIKSQLEKMKESGIQIITVKQLKKMFNITDKNQKKTSAKRDL